VTITTELLNQSDTLIHIVSHGKAKVEKRKSIKILSTKRKNTGNQGELLVTP
jgi:hypothetical protein